MNKSDPVKLEIQNVKNNISVDDVLFARKLSKKVIKRSQTTLSNGNVQIIIELDPSILGVKK